VPSAEILRIVGSNGHYAAVVKAEGGNKTVYVGDKMPDGSTVASITPTKVEVKSNGVSHQLEVKGVENVYGSAL
jgi:type II secretory pathway component PulC